MKLVVLTEAEEEFREATLWYDLREQGVGNRFLDELALAFLRIEKDPTSLPLLETSEHSSREFRRCLLETFPYAVVFEVVGDEIRVIAVSHAHRQPNYWADRL